MSRLSYRSIETHKATSYISLKTGTAFPMRLTHQIFCHVDFWPVAFTPQCFASRRGIRPPPPTSRMSSLPNATSSTAYVTFKSFQVRSIDIPEYMLHKGADKTFFPVPLCAFLVQHHRKGKCPFLDLGIDNV